VSLDSLPVLARQMAEDFRDAPVLAGSGQIESLFDGWQSRHHRV